MVRAIWVLAVSELFSPKDGIVADGGGGKARCQMCIRLLVVYTPSFLRV